MEFEDLQKIWDTQNDKPAFAMQDARLLVALYQQREHSRRRLFNTFFVPVYIMAPIGLAGVACLFFAFLWKSIHIDKIGRDFPMTPWDYVAFAVAAGAVVAMVVPMYVKRRRHERTQQAFAPSLREELDWGIAQLDFEMGLHNTRETARICGFMTIAVTLFTWEAGRLNGNPAPWDSIWMTPASMFVIIVASYSATEKAVERLMQRRRALESMLTLLKEDGPLRR